MSRFGRSDGIVVSVADEHDERYGAGWTKLTPGQSMAPSAQRRARASHDDPTPSGRIPRQQREETQTGQIRRQQAADPFGNR